MQLPILKGPSRVDRPTLVGQCDDPTRADSLGATITPGIQASLPISTRQNRETCCNPYLYGEEQCLKALETERDRLQNHKENPWFCGEIKWQLWGYCFDCTRMVIRDRPQYFRAKFW